MAFIDTVSRVHNEQRQKFLGTASIRLDALDFSLAHDEKFSGSEPDWANVESLGGLFLNGLGFAPHHISHQIPALIDQAQLSQALENVQVSPETLRRTDVEIVELEFAAGAPVRCLRGQDRVLAAMRVASDVNKRWVIRLYAEDLSLEARNDLRDERSHEKEPSDAEHFYWTTRFWLEHDTSFTPSQNKWLAQLARKSKSKAKSVERLWANHMLYKNLIREFEKTPALFWGTHLGNIGKWIAMPIEMNINQIRRIIEFWQNVCGSDDSIKSRLSMRMLKVASGKAPGADEWHRDCIRDKTSEVLGNFDEEERNKILSRLEDSTRDRLVPTLDIFFKNLVYLKDVLRCFSHLVNSRVKDIRKALLAKFEPNSLCLLQVSDNRCRWVETSGIVNFDKDDKFEVAYRQLWIFAMREFPSLLPTPNRKKAGSSYHVDEAKVYQFALLAQKLGCRTPQVSTILKQPPTTLPTPEVNPDRGGTTDKSSYSDGKPGASEHQDYKHSLFFADLHKPFDRYHSGSKFFFSQRSLYFDIFGDKFEGADKFLSASDISDEVELVDGASRQKEQGDAVEKSIRELLETKANLEQEVTELQNLIKSERMALEHAKRGLAEIVDEGLRERQNNDAIDQSIKENQEKHSRLLKKLETLTERISQKKKTLEDITSKEGETNDAFDQSFKENQEKHLRLLVKLEKLREQINEREKTLEDITSKETDQRSDFAAEVQRLEAEIKVFGERKEELAKNETQLNNTKSSLQMDIERLQNEAAELQTTTQKTVSSLQDEKCELEGKINGLKKEVEQLDGNLVERLVPNTAEEFSVYKAFILMIDKLTRTILMDEEELQSLLGAYSKKGHDILDEDGREKRIIVIRKQVRKKRRQVLEDDLQEEIRDLAADPTPPPKRIRKDSY